MQRPSEQQRREDSGQFLQHLENEAAIHHRLTSEGLVQGQRRPSEQGPPSRPVSPLLAPPSVKARPSSAVGEKLVTAQNTNNIPADNTATPTTAAPATIRTVSKDSDSPPQSPIAFLGSAQPLIQTQDPEPSLAEITTSAQSNTTISVPQSSSAASAYWSSSSTSIPTPTASHSASTTANHLVSTGDIRAPSPTLLPGSAASAYSQQRATLQTPSPLSSIAPSAERGANTITTGKSVSGSTAPRYTSTGYLQQPSIQPRSGKTPGSPTSPKEEKKKKGWLSFLGGSSSSKDTSSSSTSTASTQQSSRNSPLQRADQDSSPFRREKPKQKPTQQSVPPPGPTKETKPQRSGSTLNSSSSQQPTKRVLQKKKNTRQAEKKQQIYQNPRANNNSPEPSIVSKLTNEEQDRGRKDSNATASTGENNLSAKSRHLPQSSLEISESIPSRSSSLLHHPELDSERGVKSPFSQSQQSEGLEQNSVTDWESRLGEGEDYNPRSASKGDTFTLESAGASAQTQRAELKHREERFVSNSRPPSRQSTDSASPFEVIPNSIVYQHNTLAQNSNQTRGYMGGSGGQQHSAGRNGESQNSSSTREGQYGASLSVNNQQSTASYRNTPQASPMVQDTGSNAGRSTPPPPAGPVAGATKSREDLTNMDVQQLATQYHELNEKYRKVKKYYFDKDAQVQNKDSQVQALQNQLAHQRLAQSRTNLDDNDYMARFGRLDGAINNLAFNVRKEWKAVPSWLSHCVNKDATAIVTKEMTAVGRACISRWLVDEVFDRYFHPGLEPHLSCQLKVIERNIRRFLPQPQTDEEKDAHVAKMSNWRLSTLDGLKGVLESAESKQYRDELTYLLVTMLTEDLRENLKEPTPAGLDAGVSGIIELAVGLAANIPYESRDIFVDYLMPGEPVNEAVMKVEASLPALTNPGEGPSEQERPSMDNGDDREDDGEFGADGGPKKKGILGSLMGGRGKSQEGSFPKDQRVRFAAFMVVESRGGKTVLMKAPVYV